MCLAIAKRPQNDDPFLGCLKSSILDMVKSIFEMIFLIECEIRIFILKSLHDFWGCFHIHNSLHPNGLF